MCMNCGCGELNERHKDTDIVLDDLKEAAEGQGKTMEETKENMKVSMEKIPMEE